MEVYSGIRLEMGVDYSSIQNCVWVCHFVSVTKILVYWINVREWPKHSLTSNNFENKPTMGWNDVILTCMLDAVYQIQNIDFERRRKNLSLLFSRSLISSAVLLQIFLWSSCKGLDLKLK